MFNKYVTKTMLEITNFPKFNKKCIKILKCLHKILIFERVKTRNENSQEVVLDSVDIKIIYFRKLFFTENSKLILVETLVKIDKFFSPGEESFQS